MPTINNTKTKICGIGDSVYFNGSEHIYVVIDLYDAPYSGMHYRLSGVKEYIHNSLISDIRQTDKVPIKIVKNALRIF